MIVRCGICGNYREDDGHLYCIPCNADKVRENLPVIEHPPISFDPLPSPEFDAGKGK